MTQSVEIWRDGATMDDPIMTAKANLRAQMRQQRAELTGEAQRQMAQAATQNFLRQPWVHPARTFALYAAVKDEIATEELANCLWQRGATCLFPRVEPANLEPGHLDFASVPHWQALQAAPFGLLEPSAVTPRATLEDIEVVVVPGLAFDGAGNRLGWGRGYYDRCLGNMPQAIRAAFCYDFQRISHVPTHTTDIKVDVLITNKGVYPTGARDQLLRRVP